jgi:hypothetical protein
MATNMPKCTEAFSWQDTHQWRRRALQETAALRCFTNEYEVPDKLIFDGSGEQTRKNTDFMKNTRRYDIKHHVIEPDRHNQNHAEGTIRELRKKWFRVMLRKKVPRCLWDYGLKNVSEIMQ